jgi:hypothetical protein
MPRRIFKGIKGDDRKPLTERKAVEHYGRIVLKEVYPLVGNKTTYLSDLQRAGRKLLGNKFHGVYPSDHIPRLNDIRPYAILNLDRSTESGSHWIAIGKIPNEDKVVVYDSFGRASGSIIAPLQFSGNGRIVDADRDPEQKPKETNCGARSLGWLCVFDRYGWKTAQKI